MKQKLITVFITANLFFWDTYNFVNAQLPVGVPISLAEIEARVSRVGQFMINIGIVLAVVFLAWAGISYMKAGADPTKVNEAKGKLISGVIGALILLGIGVILQTAASVVARQFFFG